MINLATGGYQGWQKLHWEWWRGRSLLEHVYCGLQVARIVRRLKVEWPGRSYNLLNRNCCHFCEDLCHQLGIGPVPGWLNRFATGIEATINFADKVAYSVRHFLVSCSGLVFTRTIFPLYSWLLHLSTIRPSLYPCHDSKRRVYSLNVALTHWLLVLPVFELGEPDSPK